ncbi:MAG: hypothetical protein JWM47_1589 [Acidimicrobiales bacterium]|nr:hypothetical protein [Acidimicrobiales bacterium]
MVTGPVSARLDDGRRLHLQHGPMDLVLEVTASPAVAERAEAAAWQRFVEVLDELVPQLAVLRTAVAPDVVVEGSIARRMVDAAGAFGDVFVTPMAAVAGSVAQEVCETIAAVGGVHRAYVNNGGDIAFHLADGESLSVGLVGAVDAAGPDATTTITAASGIRGVATSGWGGRSFSLGIADAVTVLATTAALADVAATLVANAVDLPGHPGVERLPADVLDPDSDLGGRLVTVDVGPLAPFEVALALDRGQAEADRLLAANPDLRGVVIALAGSRRVIGSTSLARWPDPAPREDAAHVAR